MKRDMVISWVSIRNEWHLGSLGSFEGKKLLIKIFPIGF